MFYDDKSISTTVSFYCSHDDTICDREDRRAYRCSYIDSEVTSSIFFVVELVVSHIRGKISIVKDKGVLGGIIGIS